MYRGSASRSVDRPSLFARKGINKRRGGTVYGARSHDKIGSCKSAGYLTGRRTIFEYPSLTALPSPPVLFSTSCRSLVLPTRVLRVSSPRSRRLSPHSRQFFITSCSPNDFSLFSLFFVVFFSSSFPSSREPGRFGPAGPRTLSRPKITKLGHG